jgi:acetylornithine deacetylase/succinyl-diaminopimelate desuccinylase-like protein
VLVNAGFRGNVIPGSADATINIRTIPGTATEDLIREIRGVIDDPHVEISVPVRVAGMTRPQRAADVGRGVGPSSQDTDLYRALAASAKSVFPEAEVTPYLFQAGTDAVAWRSRGVPVYGIYPYPIDPDDLGRMHGNDERVSVESLRHGTELIYRTLRDIAARK